MATNVRLNGSHHPNQGRVEIFQKGKWGKICDEGWDIKDASVVCRELGLPDVTRTFGGQIFETGSEQFLIGKVGCLGTEPSLVNCTFNRVGDGYYCYSSKEANVVCGEQKAKFQLVGGRSVNEGRVQVAFGRVHTPRRREWTLFCDRDWGIQDARVVCRTLGYEDAMFVVKPHMFNDNGGMYYLIKDLRCHGNESSIAECEYTGLKQYDSCEEVGVICGVRNATVLVSSRYWTVRSNIKIKEAEKLIIRLSVALRQIASISST
ncbi:hypothetical protein QZH41_004790 [Actinostola sp. cb2023]|nr:hypothetical protein QZH41_004790 [Actinostola sp. cb2023]